MKNWNNPFLAALIMASLSGLAPAGPPAAEQATDFVICPGDVLKISVANEEDMTVSSKVFADGTILYPILGKLKAAGRRVSELRDEIQTLLRQDYVVGAQVTVAAESLVPQSIFVQGRVARPGEMSLSRAENLSVFDIIVRAGGLTEDAIPNETKIIRTKENSATDKEVLVVPLGDIYKGLGFEKNVAVKPGDIIVVPGANVPGSVATPGDETGYVYILGAVGRPNIYRYTVRPGRPFTIIEAVTLAGGFTELAKERETKVVRTDKDGRQTILKADVESIFERGELDNDIPLSSGDRIIVPSRERPPTGKVYIAGEVRGAGALNIPAGETMTVGKAILMAGGLTEYAKASKTKVIRPSPIDGKVEEIIIDIGNVLKKGNITDDVVVQPGDFIIVPQSIFNF